jgi:hypothetical protein
MCMTALAESEANDGDLLNELEARLCPSGAESDGGEL